VLQYTNPVWTALLAVWVLGERMRRWEAALVLASLLGVVLIARPDFLFGAAVAGLDPLAVAVSLVGAMFSAGAYVTVRKLGRTEHPLVIVFYFSLVTVPISLLGLTLGAVWPTPAEWLLLIGVGVTAQAGQVYLTRGPAAGAGRPGHGDGLPPGRVRRVWGAVFFADLPDRWTLAGAARDPGERAGARLDPAHPPSRMRVVEETAAELPIELSRER
jgi:hypothetical protein